MATNSLVAKSVFKDLNTREGALSNGLNVADNINTVVHERRSTNRALGQQPQLAYGSANTPKTAIGLSLAGAAISGQRKVSNERKVSIQSSTDRYSRSESKENQPKKMMPRKSLAYRATLEGERVTKSPFLGRGDDSEDEVPPSPPTRSSNRRKSSPSARLRAARTSMSPSSSPQPRVVSGSQSAPALARELLPTTPSRKTVTFQAVPDIKEFEVLSTEVSLASVAPTDLEDNEEWIDDGDVDWVGQVVREEIDERNASRDANDISIDSEDMAPTGNVSATADFMDSLIEEGLFTEEQNEDEAFGDEFEIPMESFSEYIDRGGDDTPMASTPVSKQKELPESPRHVHTFAPHLPPGQQPNLPHTDDHSMLRTADAHQPALPGAHASSSPGPHARQEGVLYDPFITIQTATDVLVSHGQRSEGDVPLGRTSHAERVQAARMLATQKLGLGFPGHMPRSGPAAHEADPDSSLVNAALDSDVFGAVIASPAKSKADRKASETIELEGPSKRMSQFRAAKASTPRKQAPPPAQIEVPSPVQAVSPAQRQSLLPMTLPDIGTSPLMTPVQSEDDMTEDEAPPVPKSRVSDVVPKLSFMSDLGNTGEGSPSTPRVSSNPPHLELTGTPAPDLDDVSRELASADLDDLDDVDDEPLTPPHALGRSVREESPRIPSLDFEKGLGLGSDEDVDDNVEGPPSPSPATPRPITIITAPSPSPGTPTRSGPSTPLTARPVSPGTPTRTSATPTRSPRSPLSAAPITSEEEDSPRESEFGDIAHDNANGTTTRVRQRITRQMVRDNVDKRVAAGDLTSRPASMPVGPRLSMIDAPRRRNVSPLRIAPRTPKKDASPGRSPVSPTASAALQQFRDSNDSPQSALDRIMNQLGNDNVPSEPNTPTKVSSIIRKTSDSTEEPNNRTSLAGSIRNVPDTVNRRKSRRRRSASLSEATPRRLGPRLTLGGIGKNPDSILDDVRTELDQIGSQRGYRVRERSHVRATYTGGLAESKAGNLEVGKACRPVRRPSDMNEHAKALRNMRAREASEGTASGTIFVKVLGVEALNLPLPAEDTQFCITIDNGIDYVQTPYSVLKDGAKVEQEFCLVEHPNFEFSLALDIRRDKHIVKLVEERAAAKAAVAAHRQSVLAASMAATATAARLEPPKPLAPARSHSPVGSMSSSRGFGAGWRSLFSSSPRKNKHQRTQSTPLLSQSTSGFSTRGKAAAPVIPPAPPAPAETLARYLVETGGDTIAKTHIAFKPIAEMCEAKVLEIRYPMFAMFKPEGSAQRQQVGKITIQIMHLPPLPGLTEDERPGTIEETLKGLKYHRWHLDEYNSGTLTQLGGDCRMPRRRHFRLVGGNLIVSSLDSGKEVATIDLALATEITDMNAPNPNRDDEDDYDPFSARPRSFRLKFSDGEKINFSADNDEDKAVWMDVFERLVGHIPANPLWAQMLDEHLATAAAQAKAAKANKPKTSTSGPGAESESPKKATAPRRSSRNPAAAA
jgi:hypothetical protein